MRSIRFIRRDGLRLFLDSRDLIRLIEQSKPMNVPLFIEVLRSHNARIVLTYTNIAELVPQNDTVRPDPARVRWLLDELEQIPHTYWRDVTRDEFRVAVEAFENGRRISRVDPFVDHWWETAWITPPWIARKIERPENVALRDHLSLADQVIVLLDDPCYLRFKPHHGVDLVETFAADRNAFGTSRGSQKALEGAITRLITSYGWSEPKGGISAFVKFVRETPEACAGWRARFDVWEEFRCDLNAKPEVNDISDMAHVKILPYVSLATLDRPWRSRCRQVRDRLKKKELWYEPFDRVFENVEHAIKAMQEVKAG